MQRTCMSSRQPWRSQAKYPSLSKFRVRWRSRPAEPLRTGEPYRPDECQALESVTDGKIVAAAPSHPGGSLRLAGLTGLRGIAQQPFPGCGSARHRSPGCDYDLRRDHNASSAPVASQVVAGSGTADRASAD